jgi:hypothetical protein
MTPAERLRQHQRSLQKAQRELDREKGKLEAQEKKTMMDIKKNAKAGQMVCPVGSRPGAYLRQRLRKIWRVITTPLCPIMGEIAVSLLNEGTGWRLLS